MPGLIKLEFDILLQLRWNWQMLHLVNPFKERRCQIEIARVDQDFQVRVIFHCRSKIAHDVYRLRQGYGRSRGLVQKIPVFFHVNVEKNWNFLHQPPGAPIPLPQAVNVMGDLAAAMKYNPDLKVLVNAGYFDLATPFFEGVYEMQHLPIPAKLQKNIEFKFYESGHMVYAHEASLKGLHNNVAAFIVSTQNPAPQNSATQNSKTR